MTLGARLDDREKIHLWQQRLFETVTGFTRFVVEARAGTDFPAWLQLQAAIFRNLPGPEDPSVDLWKRAFFGAQALLEQFVVAHYGHGAIPEWTDANAEVYRRVEPDGGRGAEDVVGRIARQAELYSSRYRVTDRSPTSSSITIDHCAIWDYRERARGCGVPITLDSPCTYCTKAVSAMIRAKGFEASWELSDGVDGRGCRWEARSQRI